MPPRRDAGLERQRSLTFAKLFGSAETPIQDITTSDGTSIWASDGVHLTSPAYRVTARFLMAELEKADHGDVGEPALKRARLKKCGPGACAAASKASGQAAAAAATEDSDSIIL
jgi:hypothetical protein